MASQLTRYLPETISLSERHIGILPSRCGPIFPNALGALNNADFRNAGFVREQKRMQALRSQLALNRRIRHHSAVIDVAYVPVQLCQAEILRDTPACFFNDVAADLHHGKQAIELLFHNECGDG